MARLRRGDGSLIRDLNRAAILGLVWEHGLIARVEIARRLALSAAAVTDITRELVDDGVLREVEEGASSGGRRPILLGLVGPAAQAIGAKIALDHLAIVRVALDGTVLARDTVAFEATHSDALERLVAVLAGVVDGSGAFPGRLLGVGLGMPGIVDAGGVVQAPTLGWSNVAMGPMLRARLSVPVLVDNDVNTLAVAERLYGLGRGLRPHHHDHDRPRRRPGHRRRRRPVSRCARRRGRVRASCRCDPDGPLCTCGRRGCLEALIAEAALVRAAFEAGVVDPVDPTARRGAPERGGRRRSRPRGPSSAGRRDPGPRGRGPRQRAQPALGSSSAGRGRRPGPTGRPAFETSLRGAVFPPLTGVDVRRSTRGMTPSGRAVPRRSCCGPRSRRRSTSASRRTPSASGCPAGWTASVATRTASAVAWTPWPALTGAPGTP